MTKAAAAAVAAAVDFYLKKWLRKLHKCYANNKPFLQMQHKLMTLKTSAQLLTVLECQHKHILQVHVMIVYTAVFSTW